MSFYIPGFLEAYDFENSYAINLPRVSSRQDELFVVFHSRTRFWELHYSILTIQCTGSFLYRILKFLWDEQTEVIQVAISAIDRSCLRCQFCMLKKTVYYLNLLDIFLLGTSPRIFRQALCEKRLKFLLSSHLMTKRAIQK